MATMKRLIDPVSFAFGIKLIREEILEKVMWEEEVTSEDPSTTSNAHRKKLNSEGVASLRLVCRSWCQTVTKLLRCARDPFLSIGAEKDIFDEFEDDSIINFLALMTSKDSLYPRPRLDGPREVPTYRLKLYPNFFTEENQDDLSDLLGQLGSGLVELGMNFPVDATMVGLNFGKLDLPRLRDLKVNLREMTLDGEDAQAPDDYRLEGEPVPDQSFLPLLQLILNASRDLRSLTFYQSFYVDLTYFPVTFSQMTLPGSLTHLQFNFAFPRPSDLQVLLTPENHLPQLTSLTLYAISSPFERMTVFEVLRRIRNSLRQLVLEGSKWSDEVMSWEEAVAERTELQFPVMVELRRIEVKSGRWTLVPGVTHVMNKFPRLEGMRLEYCPEVDFRGRWSNNAVYGTVRKVTLGLVGFVEGVDREPEEEEEEDEEEEDAPEEENDEVDQEVEAEDDEAVPEVNEGEEEEDPDPADEDEEDDDELEVGDPIMLPRRSPVTPLLPISAPRMALIRQTFPHVTHLSLTFLESPEIAGGIQLIFTDLRQLISLELKMTIDTPEQILDAFWNALLTGLSAEQVEEIWKGPPEEIETSADKLLDNDKPSIRNLGQLEGLLLAVGPVDEESEPVISDLAFHLGFLKMAKLAKLELGGGFKASAPMITRWKALHGADSFKFSPVLHSN